MQFSENPYAPPQIPAEIEQLPTDAREIKNPWLSIWLYPRDTIHWIVATKPTYYVLMLGMINGVVGAFQRARKNNLGDDGDFLILLLMIFLMGSIIGIVQLWIFAPFVQFTGYLLQGKATQQQLRAALAWSAVPCIVLLIVWGGQLAILGDQVFTSIKPNFARNHFHAVVYSASLLVECMLGGWVFILNCNTLAEVQGFRSAWSGLLNIILAATAIFIPIMAVIFVLAVIMAR